MARYYTKKRKPIRKKSKRKIRMEKCDVLLREILKKKRGNKCEICGRTPNNLGLFHILHRSTYPRLTYHEANILLACWMPCHYNYHHYCADDSKYQRIKSSIMGLRGNDYAEKLKLFNRIAPPLSLFRIDLIYENLKQRHGRIIGGGKRCESRM